MTPVALEMALTSTHCTANRTVATTITWVIDDGSIVKKDQLLVELDDSGLQEQLKTQKITLDTNKGNMIQAEEAYKITIAQNESDIKGAEIDLELAKIDLRKYREGDFPQSLNDLDGKISSAQSDLEMQRDRTAWAQRMMKKGYYTVSQVQGEQSRLESYELNLRSLVEQKRVLVDPEYGLKKRTETDLATKVSLAERKLNQIKAQALAKEVQTRTDRDTKKAIYLESLAQYEETQAEIKKCKIYAPQEGMVVYFIPDQARYGGGSQQSIVAQGEPVREGQRLMQIPDLRHMQVSTRVHEALVSRVHAGQPATVRVDSFPDRVFHGKVESVATISAQQDWLSADVKVYTTKVGIDESIVGLKPGMSAEVTIVVDGAGMPVLTVPIQAILGGTEMGKHRKCFVLDAAGQPREQDIEVGLSNERMAEIKSGLHEGDRVVLNPRAILGDKAKGPSESAPEPGEAVPGKRGPGTARRDGPRDPGSQRGIVRPQAPDAAPSGRPTGAGRGPAAGSPRR